MIIINIIICYQADQHLSDLAKLERRRQHAARETEYLRWDNNIVNMVFLLVVMVMVNLILSQLRKFPSD